MKPMTAKPSGLSAASPKLEYLSVFQWTKWSYGEKKEKMFLELYSYYCVQNSSRHGDLWPALTSAA